MEPAFGEVLRRLRTDRGLSQQQLADCLFVDRSSIARWENGKRVPDLTERLQMLCAGSLTIGSGAAGGTRVTVVISLKQPPTSPETGKN